MADLYLHGMGHFHPDNVIDNAFLEALDIGTDEIWILDRVGIRTRHTVLPLDYIRETKNADPRRGHEVALLDSRQTAAGAAEMALDRAGIDRGQIGLVVAGGCYPDMAIPAEASRIAGAMEIDAPGVDINTACSSFGAQMHFLAAMGPALPDYVLVVNPENTTPVIDYADRRSAVLWGDGTAAAVVSARVPAPRVVRATSIAADSARWGAVCIPRFGHFYQDGNAVQRFAIKTTLACAQALEPEARRRTDGGGRVRFVGHQANLLMLHNVVTRLGMDESAHWYNVDDYGNTGAAGAPTVLSQHWDDLTPGDSVIFVVVGAGLTWSSLRLDVEDV